MRVRVRVREKILDSDGGSRRRAPIASCIQVKPVTAPAARTSSPGSRKARPASARRRSKISLPAIGRDHAVLVGRAIVANPYNANERQEVRVNRCVDILAQERAAGRITESQMLVGRTVQAVIERASGARLGSGGWNHAGSRDQTVAHELQILLSIEDARKVREFEERMRAAIGGAGVQILRAILAEGHSFASYAAKTGKGSSERAASDIAKRFRWLLEALTDAHHTATGADGQRIRATREVE